MAKDDIQEADAGPSTDGFATGMVIFTTIALAAAWFIIHNAEAATYPKGG